MKVYLFHLLQAGSWGVWSSHGSLKPQIMVQMPKSWSQACGVWEVRIYMWATEGISMFTVFSLCFFISQEHFWYALLFCWTDWIFNLLMHISRTCWIEISCLFFHSCFLSPMFAGFLEFNMVLKSFKKSRFFIKIYMYLMQYTKNHWTPTASVFP